MIYNLLWLEPENVLGVGRKSKNFFKVLIYIFRRIESLPEPG